MEEVAALEPDDPVSHREAVSTNWTALDLRGVLKLREGLPFQRSDVLCRCWASRRLPRVLEDAESAEQIANGLEPLDARLPKHVREQRDEHIADEGTHA